jgi:hypothetical protein
MYRLTNKISILPLLEEGTGLEITAVLSLPILGSKFFFTLLFLGYASFGFALTKMGCHCVQLQKDSK